MQCGYTHEFHWLVSDRHHLEEVIIHWEVVPRYRMCCGNRRKLNKMVPCSDWR